jgi:hypothetical protein
MSPNLVLDSKNIRMDWPHAPMDFRFEFDPLEYFYPYFGRSNRKGKKKLKLFATKKYKSFFENDLSWSLPKYLWAIEKETEIQCADRSMRSVGTQIAEEDETIYELVRRLGPRALRMPSILNAIEDWCLDRKFGEFDKLIKAIKQYQKQTFDSGPYEDREILHAIGFHFSTVRNSIRQLKKDITRAGRAIESKSKTEPERVLRKWEQKLRDCLGNPKLKKFDWYENLRQISKRKHFGEQPKNIVGCVRKNTPRWLAIMLLSRALNRGWAVADRAVRHHKKIAKTVYI